MPDLTLDQIEKNENLKSDIEEAVKQANSFPFQKVNVGGTVDSYPPSKWTLHINKITKVSNGKSVDVLELTNQYLDGAKVRNPKKVLEKVQLDINAPFYKENLDKFINQFSKTGYFSSSTPKYKLAFSNKPTKEKTTEKAEKTAAKKVKAKGGGLDLSGTDHDSVHNGLDFIKIPKNPELNKLKGNYYVTEDSYRWNGSLNNLQGKKKNTYPGNKVNPKMKGTGTRKEGFETANPYLGANNFRLIINYDGDIVKLKKDLAKVYTVKFNLLANDFTGGSYDHNRILESSLTELRERPTYQNLSYTVAPVKPDGNLHEDSASAKFISGSDYATDYNKKNGFFDWNTDGRSPEIDIGIPANRVLKKDDVSQFGWFLSMNQSDYSGIDDGKNKSYFQQIKAFNEGLKKRGLKPQKNLRFMIVGGSADQKDTVMRQLGEHLTKREMKLLTNTVIMIKKPQSRGAAGTYHEEHDHTGDSTHIISVDPKYVKAEDPTVIVHEVIHLLRNKDDKRKGVAQYRKKAGYDIDLEEAATDLETVSRTRPYKNSKTDLPGSPNVTGAGYYQHLLEERFNDEGFGRYAPSKVVDQIYGVEILNTPEYKKYMDQSIQNYVKKFPGVGVNSQTQYVFAKNFVEALDRLTINDPAGKDQNLAKEKSNAQRKKLFKKAAESAIGKNKSLLKPRVGLGAARSINSRIGQTAISRSKLRGRNQEVYDRYFVAKNKNGKIVAELHINNRTPDSMKSYNLSKLEIDNLIKDRPGDSVFELKDGKEKLLWQNKGNKLLKLERKGKL